MLSSKLLCNFILEKRGDDTRRIKFEVNGYRQLNESLLGNCRLDLNDGFTGAIYETAWDKFKNFEPILHALMARAPDGSLKTATQGAQVVARRGLLVMLAKADYMQKRGNFRIVCERRKDVIFIEEEGIEERYDMSKMSHNNRRFTYWGSRFEEYAVSSPQLNTSTDNYLMPEHRALRNRMNGDIRLLIRSELRDLDGERPISLICAGEIDAIDSEGDFVEIKTQAFDANPLSFFRDKSLDWWLQSYLLGIKKIFLGIRDDGGIVRKCKMFNIDELKNTLWSGEYCLSFLHYVLNGLVRNLKEGESCEVICKEGRLSHAPIPATGMLSPEFRKHFKL